MIKWFILVHLTFLNQGLNRHLSVPYTYNPFNGYGFESECVRDANQYNRMYGGVAVHGVIEHAFCTPVTLPPTEEERHE